jgi:hypothetical protein
MKPKNEATNSLNEDDVICGRGKHCFCHPGNQKFRKLVETFLPAYAKASCKVEKSVVVSNIVDAVRRSSPNGGFVKQDEVSGNWMEVGDHLAREKVGQALRDAMHTEYRSSKVSKKNRRKVEQAQLNSNMFSLIERNVAVATVISNLSREVSMSDDLPDESVGAMFNAANATILQELKKINWPDY